MSSNPFALTGLEREILFLPADLDRPPSTRRRGVRFLDLRPSEEKQPGDHGMDLNSDRTDHSMNMPLDFGGYTSLNSPLLLSHIQDLSDDETTETGHDVSVHSIGTQSSTVSEAVVFSLERLWVPRAVQAGPWWQDRNLVEKILSYLGPRDAARAARTSTTFKRGVRCVDDLGEIMLPRCHHQHEIPETMQSLGLWATLSEPGPRGAFRAKSVKLCNAVHLGNLASLRRLERLNLWGSKRLQLDTLPSHTWLFQRLEELLIWDANLTDVQALDRLGTPSNVAKLSVGNNEQLRLDTLPHGVFTNVRELTLCECGLRDLSNLAAFGQPGGSLIERLDLCGNEIQLDTIPKGLLPRLRGLDLSSSGITDLSPLNGRVDAGTLELLELCGVEQVNLATLPTELMESQILVLRVEDVVDLAPLKRALGDDGFDEYHWTDREHWDLDENGHLLPNQLPDNHRLRVVRDKPGSTTTSLQNALHHPPPLNPQHGNMDMAIDGPDVAAQTQL